MAEYGSMFTVSGLASILFFGGWNGPFPIFGPDALGWAYTPQELADGTFRLTGYLANLAGCANFLGKAVLGVTVMMWVRWTLPRLRIDQVMTTCLKYCVPLAAVCFLGVVGWQFGFGVLDRPVPFLNDLMPAARRGEVREAWTFRNATAAVQPAAAGDKSQDGETDGKADDAKPAEGEPKEEGGKAAASPQSNQHDTPATATSKPEGEPTAATDTRSGADS